MRIAIWALGLQDLSEEVSRLGSEDPGVRDEATRRLAERGDGAIAELERALGSKDLEIEDRARWILRGIEVSRNPRRFWSERLRNISRGMSAREIGLELQTLHEGTPQLGRLDSGGYPPIRELYRLDRDWKLVLWYDREERLVRREIIGFADFKDRIAPGRYALVKEIHDEIFIEGYAFDPIAAIRIVNKLHALGKAEALAVLREYAALDPHEHSDPYLVEDNKVVPIVNALFECSKEEARREGWKYSRDVVGDIPLMVFTNLTYMRKSSFNARHILETAEHRSLRARPLRPSLHPLEAVERVSASYMYLHPVLKSQAARILAQVEGIGERELQELDTERLPESWGAIVERWRNRRLQWDPEKQTFRWQR
jgi:hypothetical protein